MHIIFLFIYTIRYPTIVDKALEDVFASLPDTIEDGDEEVESRPKRRRTRRNQATRTDWLHSFITLALPQSRHQLLGEGRGHPSSMLVLSVHHTNPSMRAAAVKQLGKSLKDASQEVYAVSIVYTTSIYVIKFNIHV
jgi:hypothetical protein